MKIAVVTDDGVSVAQHFGRARYYQVFQVDDGSVIASELRDRMDTIHHGRERDDANRHGHHHDNANRSHHQVDHGHKHPHGSHAAERHAAMLQQITDVDVVIAGGMGVGARRALADAGITIVATDLDRSEAAVTAYLDGTILHDEERFH